jgi:hypothetical protein
MCFAYPEITQSLEHIPFRLYIVYSTGAETLTRSSNRSWAGNLAKITRVIPRLLDLLSLLNNYYFNVGSRGTKLCNYRIGLNKN